MACASSPCPRPTTFRPARSLAWAESLVIDFAYFVVWAGIYAPQHQVPPGHVYRLKHRLFAKLQAHFTPRQIEELLWRIVQCVAFNWHNDFLELDLEPEVKNGDRLLFLGSKK
ncbi:MAG: hypothetical protein KatS3mg131_4013 [Candidatus Tectimicrobiota bacterium]|nr:MAG: hypothetical protein KatS3mg131_4013 [Candidatus Tectomicrobia bacterium]